MGIRGKLVGLALALALLLAVTGCGGGNRPTPQDDESASQAAAYDFAYQCLEAWLNTEAPLSTIDSGFEPTSDWRDPIPRPVLFEDEDGYYRIDRTASGFDRWVGDFRVPWWSIRSLALDGKDCPYHLPG